MHAVGGISMHHMDGVYAVAVSCVGAIAFARYRSYARRIMFFF